MSRLTRLWLLGVLLSGALAAPVAAFAVEEYTVAFTAAETEAEEDEAPANMSGVEPAVEAPPASEDEEEQPWTARFLAPTLLALGVVITVIATGYYATRIRGRYRVVE